MKLVPTWVGILCVRIAECGTDLRSWSEFFGVCACRDACRRQRASRAGMALRPVALAICATIKIHKNNPPRPRRARAPKPPHFQHRY